MKKIFQIGHHVWNLGHSVEVKKYNTTLAREESRGWLIKCTCGSSWSR